MRMRFDHVSAERVLSGPGLVNLYNTLAEIDGVPAGSYTSAQITDLNMGHREPRCGEAVDMFCAMLGTVASNLALTLGALGGIYIAGGIVPKLGIVFAESTFRERFEDKGRLRPYLARIPTYVVTHPFPAFLLSTSRQRCTETRGPAQSIGARLGFLETPQGAGYRNKIRIQEDERGIVLIGDIDLCNSAVLLDVDGTILDIAATPRGVAVPRRLKRALKTLWRGTSGAVAFVSGRPLGDLDRLFAPLRLAAIAGHGAEVRVSASDEPSRYDAPIGNNLRGQFEAFASKVDGIILEDKGYSLALHYRLAPEHAETVLEAVKIACAVYPKSAIEVLLGKAVIEVKSRPSTRALASAC
jgi:hypothetical protein